MEKLIKDGKVAVLYSPGFGAGWFSWDHHYGEALLFDKEMAEAILDGDSAVEIAQRKYPDAYLGGVPDLRVYWVPQGSQFKIDEYDGSESVSVVGNQEYITA